MCQIDFSDKNLIEALEALWRDCEKRQQLGTNALERNTLQRMNPLRCAAALNNAVEHFIPTRL